MIMPPEITSVGEVYDLDWKEQHVHIHVDHLFENSQGFYGEFTVRLNGTSMPGHLQHARINLLAGSAKKGLAKQLNDRIAMDWDAIIEQACVKVLQENRRGEPVVLVGNLPSREAPRYRLFPYILENEISFIYGMGGVGKSYFATYLALCVQCGHEFFNTTPIKGEVLYLDWEASSSVIDERVKALKKGMEIQSDELLHYKRCNRLLKDIIAEIQSIVLDNKIKLIVIDSVGMASGFEDYHNTAIALLRALRSLNISAICIDHKPKKDDSVFGSSYKMFEARSIFEIQDVQSAGEMVKDIAIFHRKINDGRLVKPASYHIEFQGDDEETISVVITKQDINRIAEFSEGLPLKEQIKEALTREAMTSSEIAEAIGAKEQSVKTVLYRNKETFVKLQDKYWGLLHNE